jgi:hypothetical protein
MKICTAHVHEFLPHGITEGSISTGTLKEEDLIARFHDWIGDNCAKKPDVYYEVSCNSEAETDELLADLFDFLETVAGLHGFRFGAHEGDGADIGFWKDETWT